MGSALCVYILVQYWLSELVVSLGIGVFSKFLGLVAVVEWTVLVVLCSEFWRTTVCRPCSCDMQWEV